ncbi:MAG: hypothetical protein HQ541_17710 [Mariniphaga sp.]|nr:hypothetical protein [Mariniphaga sp.]
MKTLINAAIKKRKKTTAEKLLFDLSKTSFKHFVETDRYDIGTFVANSFTNEIQAAFIIPKGYRNNLMDYIANKRGAYVKTFDKVESAEKWLLHDY